MNYLSEQELGSKTWAALKMEIAAPHCGYFTAITHGVGKKLHIEFK